MPKENEQNQAWVTPLIKTLFSAKPLGPIEPITCPVCDCEHQRFLGSGYLRPSQEGTKLTCCFPTADTMVQIDMPEQFEIGGTTLYVRYECLCNGHHWAVITAFQDERTLIWCITIPPDKKQGGCKKAPLQVIEDPQPSFPAPNLTPELPAVAATSAFTNPESSNPIQQMLTSMGFNKGQPPLIIISPEVLKSIHPTAYENLKAQLGSIVANQGMPAAVPVKSAPQAQQQGTPTLAEAAQAVTDHEHPFKIMPPKIPARFVSWLEPKVTIDDVLPQLPPPKAKAGKVVKASPPPRCAGSGSPEAAEAIARWLFALTLELQDYLPHIAALIHWNMTMLVVLEAGAEKMDIHKAVLAAIPNVQGAETLPKPLSVHPMTRKEYETLRRFKEQQAGGS